MELLSDGPFDLEELRQLRESISELVHFGTSSWNYPGWQGLVYHRKYPKSGAVTKMLTEYAEFPLFGTVGIDASFYRPLSANTYRGYREALPPGFKCVQKVWNRITIHTFTGHQDGGAAGEKNPDFLNADRCINEVIGPALEHFREDLGPFVFEVQTIARREQIDPAKFADILRQPAEHGGAVARVGHPRLAQPALPLGRHQPVRSRLTFGARRRLHRFVHHSAA